LGISVCDRKKIYQFLLLYYFICPNLQIHTASEPTATIASKPFWFTWPKARCRKQPWIRAALVADWQDTSLYRPRWPRSQKILCHILFKGTGKMKRKSSFGLCVSQIHIYRCCKTNCIKRRHYCHSDCLVFPLLLNIRSAKMAPRLFDECRSQI
jgi:hypothetical protein